MAESDALSYWPVTIVPESKLSHMATAHYGFVPKLSRHEWKNRENPIQRRLQNLYAQQFFSGAQRNGVFKGFCQLPKLKSIYGTLVCIKSYI